MGFREIISLIFLAESMILFSSPIPNSTFLATRASLYWAGFFDAARFCLKGAIKFFPGIFILHAVCIIGCIS
jgi:hypothetical protein